MYKLGIIGCGNMSTAIVSGVIKSKIFNNDEIIMSDVSEEQTNKIKEKLNIKTTLDNNEVLENSEYILLGIKPQYFESFAKNINKNNITSKIIISIMAGTKIEKIKKLMGQQIKVARIMPNTPALVNEAMSVICAENDLTQEELNVICSIFNSIGKTKILDESMLDAVTAISGSSPAYVFMMIEAMADAGVELGLTRQDAYTFAAQSILGASKMYLETNTHPAQLKDMVTSPAGTTIEALRVLENKGFRSCLIEAMIACAQKSKDMQSL